MFRLADPSISISPLHHSPSKRNSSYSYRAGPPEKAERVKWWYDGSLVEYRARGGSGAHEVGEARVWKALVGEVGEGTLARVTGSPEGSAERWGTIVGEIPQKVKIWRVALASSAAQDRALEN